MPLGDPNSASPTCHAPAPRCGPALPPLLQQHEHPDTSASTLSLAAYSSCVGLVPAGKVLLLG